jgi:hypothetical protein
MSKIGIKAVSLRNILTPMNLKREILLFDKLYIDELIYKAVNNIANSLLAGPQLAPLKSHFDFNIQNIEYLFNQGLIEPIKKSSPRVLSNPTEDEKKIFFSLQKYYDIVAEIGDVKTSFSNDKIEKTLEYFSDYPDANTRVDALVFSKTNLNDTYVPLITSSLPFTEGKESVFRFILSNIPEPSNTVPWEKILEFKNDTDTQRKYYGLKNWINEISKSNLSAQEIEDCFWYLYSEYSNQYKLHKLEFQMSAVEILFTTTAEIISSFEMPNLGFLIKPFYKLRKEKLLLAKAETSFIGRELAYIFKVSQEF